MRSLVSEEAKRGGGAGPSIEVQVVKVTLLLSLSSVLIINRRAVEVNDFIEKEEVGHDPDHDNCH